MSPDGVSACVKQMNGSMIFLALGLGKVVDPNGVVRSAYMLTARHTSQFIPGGSLILGILDHDEQGPHIGRLDGGDAYGTFIPAEVELDLVQLAQDLEKDVEDPSEYRADWSKVCIGDEESGWPEKAVYIVAFRCEPEATEAAYQAGLRIPAGDQQGYWRALGVRQWLQVDLSTPTN